MFCPDARMRRLGLAAAAAVMAVAVAGTAAAQSMVVRSTGPSASKYPTGTKLKASDKVTLVAGDRVVLIQGGKTRTLSGPGSYSGGGTVQASQTTGSTVARMLDARVHDALFTRIEGVAVRAHFDGQVRAQRGAGDEGIAAGAADGDFFVLGMDGGFHGWACGKGRAV